MSSIKRHYRKIIQLHQRGWHGDENRNVVEKGDDFLRGVRSAEVADRFGKMPEAAANLFDLRRLRIRATIGGVYTLLLREGDVIVEMKRKLERADVQRLIGQMPIPVVFKTHGTHRVEAKRAEVKGELILIAGQILDCLDQSQE